MTDHSKPTWENKLWHAKRLLREKGRAALANPHAEIGRQCGCQDCFCCAAATVLRAFDRSGQNMAITDDVEDEHDARR